MHGVSDFCVIVRAVDLNWRCVHYTTAPSVGDPACAVSEHRINPAITATSEHSHSNHEVMEWLAHCSTERFRRSMFDEYQVRVFAKICEETTLRPPVGSSAFFRADDDGGVAVSTRATSLALACASRRYRQPRLWRVSHVGQPWRFVSTAWRIQRRVVVWNNVPFPQRRRIWPRFHRWCNLNAVQRSIKEARATRWATCQP